MERDEMAGLENALRGLKPAEMGVDAMAAAFEAGRRAGQRRLRGWQVASIAAVMVLTVGMFWRTSRDVWTAPREKANTEMVEVKTPATPQVGPLGDQSDFLLERAVMEHGMEGLPEVHPASAKVIGVNGAL